MHVNVASNNFINKNNILLNVLNCLHRNNILLVYVLKLRNAKLAFHIIHLEKETGF